MTRVELLGSTTWSRFNRYLVLLVVDIGMPELELETVLPEGTAIEVVGDYDSLQVWPDST